MSRRPAVIANDRSALWIFSFILLGGMLLFLFISFSWYRGQVAPLLLAMISAVLAGLYFIQARRWRRVHQRRQLAASEDMRAGIPLARPQPTPNAVALPTPFTITLRPRWFRILGCMFLYAAVLFIQFSFNAGDTFDLRNWPFALLVAVLIGALSVLISALSSLRLFLPQRIVVYDDGLVVKDPLYDWQRTSWTGNNWQAGEYVIHWREVQLFAIRSARPGTPATRYELSSPTRVVTFGRAWRARWWALYRPIIPWAEYDAQMDALLEVITARTGLPLYDVRSGPTREPARQPASSPLS